MQQNGASEPGLESRDHANNTGHINHISLDSLPAINQPTSYENLQATLLRLSGGKELLRLSEISDILRMDYKVVYYSVTKKRNLPAHRFGGIWLVTIQDLAAYMANRSNVPVQKSPLEALVESLDPSDPKDWQFRQALDGYISDKVQEVSTEYSLTKPYALGYVVAQMSAWLKDKGPIKPRSTTKEELAAEIEASGEMHGYGKDGCGGVSK